MDEFSYAHRNTSGADRWNKPNIPAALRAIRESAFAREIPVAGDETLCFLMAQAAACRPDCILELGTAVGTTAAAMAFACPGAKITTVEREEKFYDEAVENFARLGISARVFPVLGDAGEVISRLEGQFGLIFMDSAKVQYVKYLPRLKRLLAPGGVLIADDVLYQGVQGISELITEPGEINIDFADVKTVMKGKGDALMGIGFGEGANRAVDAAKEAISNPLLENASIDGAKSVLVNLAGSDNLTLQEYQDVVELITANCAEDALIIAGQAFNPELGDRIKVTVVATGFQNKAEVTGGEVDSESALRRFVNPEPRQESPLHQMQSQHQAAPAAAQPSAPQQPAAPSRPAPTDADAITVNRWQDLQQQLGKRSQSNDYSIPAVMRYRQGEEDEGKDRR